MNTKGPWVIDDYESQARPLIRTVDRKAICVMESDPYIKAEEAEANARLIAAAPDLLETARALAEVTLYGALFVSRSRQEEVERAAAAVRAAIFKALAGGEE